MGQSLGCNKKVCDRISLGRDGAGTGPARGGHGAGTGLAWGRHGADPGLLSFVD